MATTPTKSVSKSAQTRRTAPGSSAKAKAAIKSASTTRSAPARASNASKATGATKSSKPAAPAAPKSTEPSAAPAELTPDVIAAMNDADRCTAALAEGKAKKAALKEGKEAPPTPVSEWMAANPRATRAGASRRSSSNGQPKVKMQYHCNGNPIKGTANCLSAIAWYHTKGIDGDTPRVNTKRLLEELAKLGVTDPRSKPFDVTLPNGVRLAATLPEVAESKQARVKPPARSDKRVPAQRGGGKAKGATKAA